VNKIMALHLKSIFSLTFDSQPRHVTWLKRTSMSCPIDWADFWFMLNPRRGYF